MNGEKLQSCSSHFSIKRRNCTRYYFSLLIGEWRERKTNTRRRIRSELYPFCIFGDDNMVLIRCPANRRHRCSSFRHLFLFLRGWHGPHRCWRRRIETLSGRLDDHRHSRSLSEIISGRSCVIFSLGNKRCADLVELFAEIVVQPPVKKRISAGLWMKRIRNTNQVASLNYPPQRHAAIDNHSV